MGSLNLNPADLYFNNDFNDASREILGGLWHNVVVDGNQGHGTDVRVTNDLAFVQAGLAADVAAGDFTGDTLTHVNTVLADLATEIAAIPGAVNNDAAAEQALHNAHLDIINVIQNDPILEALSVKDGNPGFNFTPPALATPVTNATPHATFAEIGVIFDDAQSRFLGGLAATPDGAAQIQKDLTIVDNSLTALMKAHPDQFQGATGIHAQTIIDQVHLQLTVFDNAYGSNVDAARATNDNLLDITDIVTADVNLANAAQAFGVHGWIPAPATDVKPVPFADNADQTNFWADFIQSSNNLGAQAEQLVQTGSAAQIAAFEKVLTGWETNVGNFEAAQGGIFSARFANELHNGANSTVAADVAAMINGLNTHNATLVTNAAEGFHANAADVSGNNAPVNGGTFNADGTAIALALNQTVAPPPPATLLTPQTPTPPSSDHHDDVAAAVSHHDDLAALVAPVDHSHDMMQHLQQVDHFHWHIG